VMTSFAKALVPLIWQPVGMLVRSWVRDRELTLVPSLSETPPPLDSCNRIGSIFPSYEKGAGVVSSAWDGLGDWPPRNTNSPVARVPSMRSSECQGFAYPWGYGSRVLKGMGRVQEL
jgi:hypothetical protein